MFCPRDVLSAGWFYPLHVLEATENLEAIFLQHSGTNSFGFFESLFLGIYFLRACFWAFIFGALGRWTELWSRLGQARCVGVMAALP